MEVDVTSETKKLTKRDYFNQLLKLDEVKGNEKLVKFISHELELLAKKNASDKSKLSATQIANEEIKNGNDSIKYNAS